MGFNQSDIEQLSGIVRLEVAQAIEPLQQQVSEMAAELDRVGDAAWALLIVVRHLENLIPPESAWAVAQSIQAELEDVPPAQRNSMAGSRLENLRAALLRRAVCRPGGTDASR